MKKTLTIGIIFLFIGVAVAPSINTSVVKTSDDLVEVTSQPCGIKGFGNTTVKLTKQQYQSLEHYLVDFRAKLNQTTTREEAVPIFKDAIVELNKFGLLPKGMSVEQAQRLVTNPYRTRNIVSILQKENYFKQNMSIGKIDNAFCLVSGHNIEILLMRVLPLYLLLTIHRLFYMYPHSIILMLLDSTIITWILVLAMINTFRNMLPISIGVSASLASYDGQLVTIGLLGRRTWNGMFTGSFFTNLDTGFWPFGILGFTGIHLATENYLFESNFIGSAVVVGIQ